MSTGTTKRSPCPNVAFGCGVMNRRKSSELRSKPKCAVRSGCTFCNSGNEGCGSASRNPGAQFDLISLPMAAMPTSKRSMFTEGQNQDSNICGDACGPSGVIGDSCGRGGD